LLLGLLLVPDDTYSAGVRASALAIPLAVLAVALALVARSGRRGASRRSWERRWSRASLRWTTSVTPVERAARPRRRLRLALVIAPLVLGTLVFLAGVWLRQPGRLAERRTWGPEGEAAIDALVLTGGAVLAISAPAILVGWAALLLVRARRDAQVLVALDRREAPVVEHADAIVLDRSPLELVATAIGAIGWLLAAAAATPSLLPVIQDADAAAPFGALALLWLPALGCLALAIVLGTRGVRSAHGRRSRVLAAAPRDPVPWAGRPWHYDRPDPWQPLLRP
ncbi:hypothetical protein, partial [Agrococcus citreus]|uniref:hypothetical protein n=1 Tax=Agrococcus citreus TaxID=84643 RepID=UPI0031D6FA11